MKVKLLNDGGFETLAKTNADYPVVISHPSIVNLNQNSEDPSVVIPTEVMRQYGFLTAEEPAYLFYLGTEAEIIDED